MKNPSMCRCFDAGLIAVLLVIPGCSDDGTAPTGLPPASVDSLVAVRARTYSSAMQLPPLALDPLENAFWIRVATAFFCGAIIGIERQIRGKPAGIRTSILICLGTCFFVVLSTALAGPGTDPTRVLGQIVTGIGFLGAGVILTREGSVLGVTSAATIWMLAAIGATIGFGWIAAALVLAAVTVAILIGVELFEASFVTLRRGVHAWRGTTIDSGE